MSKSKPKPEDELITKIAANDIICGRKGVALKHPGNISYRKVVSMNKELYATSLKNDKLRISRSIVEAMREVGGRFLERVDGRTSAAVDEVDDEGNPVAYRDIGDKRAVEKTSQALREGQPKLLRKLAEDHVIRNAGPPPPILAAARAAANSQVPQSQSQQLQAQLQLQQQLQAQQQPYGRYPRPPQVPPPGSALPLSALPPASSPGRHHHPFASLPPSAYGASSLPPSLYGAAAGGGLPPSAYAAAAASLPPSAYSSSLPASYAAAAGLSASSGRPSSPSQSLPQMISKLETELLVLALLRNRR